MRLAVRYFPARRGELVLHDRSGGLFSLYCQVLGSLFVSDLLKCSLRLRFKNGDYRTPSAHEGWWTQFFETSIYDSDRNRDGKSVELPATKSSARFAHLGVGMNRSIAHSLCNRIRIKADILGSISSFEKMHLLGRPALGVHYRGTDKLIAEAVRVPYLSMIETLSRMDSSIIFFVATDEQAFLEAMIEHFGSRVVYLDHHRSHDGTPVHHFDSDHESLGYIRGREAIMDAVLLARCKGIMRTRSNLSLASTFFNPSIPALIIDPKENNWKQAVVDKLEQALLNNT